MNKLSDASPANRKRDSTSRRILQADGAFLLFAGASAMLADLLGHYAGVGPMAPMRGSVHTIGGFEAHGLAVILAVQLLFSARLAERRRWHWIGLSIHLLLGVSNVLFWNSFRELDVIPIGVVTTALHAVFCCAHALNLRRLA